MYLNLIAGCMSLFFFFNFLSTFYFLYCAPLYMHMYLADLDCEIDLSGLYCMQTFVNVFFPINFYDYLSDLRDLYWFNIDYCNVMKILIIKTLKDKKRKYLRTCINGYSIRQIFTTRNSQIKLAALFFIYPSNITGLEVQRLHLLLSLLPDTIEYTHYL